MIRKITFLLATSLCCAFPAGAQHFRNSGLLQRVKFNHDLVETGTAGVGVWENRRHAVGGGLNYEYGGGVVVLNFNKQFYFLLDGYARLNVLDKTALGIGGTAAGEFRLYNKPLPAADYGVEISWGTNAMLYTFGPQDRFHHLYGANWTRVGLIINKNPVSRRNTWLCGNVQYFAQFQYWQGSWYTAAGMEMDSFQLKKNDSPFRYKKHPPFRYPEFEMDAFSGKKLRVLCARVFPNPAS